MPDADRDGPPNVLIDPHRQLPGDRDDFDVAIALDHALGNRDPEKSPECFETTTLVYACHTLMEDYSEFGYYVHCRKAPPVSSSWARSTFASADLLFAPIPVAVEGGVTG